jgi:UDP-N-acetyl-D-glucosamine dehydrogenase
MKNDVSIIGHGYVGLPLALQFAKSGCCVLGLDIDCSKVKEIGAGRSYEASSPSSF